ncbi:Salt stress-responsive protein YocM [Neobacillus rhizosphaerae]|uniref:Salt stress-responsive protein YocM n=1 Tax=Neobacillus rhizosphaerae TaxID=2880965 RepID=A0ABM9ENW5_9BACI|nr:Hsp20/alpha crystallin family protein [Neobacillus rhizosphaerae]CAH2714306.1 Salt stress-responsive protein YocM [Neobacillus rhizosphaerae]
MDMDKLKQWMEIAKNMHGGDFWENIFDQEFAQQFVNDQPFKSPFRGNGDKSNDEEKILRTFPLIDVIEGEKEVTVLIELPGVKKEDIQLGLSGNVLSIKGSSLPLHPSIKPSYSERYYGEFQRAITLPDSVSSNELRAKFWNGILFVSYPRTFKVGEIIPID